MQCTNCGSPVSDESKFCTKCGNSVATNTSYGIKEPVTGSETPAYTSGEMTKTSNRGVWLYGLGAAVIVISIVAAIVLLVVGITETLPDERYVFPGTQEIQFDSTGDYTIFYEYKSTVDGVAYMTGEDIPNLWLVLESEVGLQEIELSSPSTSNTYETGSRAGTSIFKFSIDEPGVYLLTAVYLDGSTTPEVVLAIGPSWDMSDLIISLLIGFGGFALGAIIILLVFLKRRKTRAQIIISQPGNVSPKSRLAVTLLAFFLGQLGIHRFYLGKYKTAVLMLLTGGGLGVWALVDFIMAVCGETKDKDSRLITRWTN